MNRPYNTLFLLSSLDGRISTGVGNKVDFDRDLPGLVGSLDSYYTAEKQMDYWSMISGNVVMKLGADEEQFIKDFHRCGHVLMDSFSLTERAIAHVANGCEELILVTDAVHGCPARGVVAPNMRILTVGNIHDAEEVMDGLYRHDIRSMTVQTGGKINSTFLRAGVIDRVDLFIAPVIVGGVGVPTIADGHAINDVSQLEAITCMELVNATATDDKLIRVVYEVQGTKGTTESKGYTIL